MGGKNNWMDIASWDNIVKKQGKWGYLDLLIEDAEYKPDQDTDCLVHFNSEALSDATNNYVVSAGKTLVSQKEFMFGGGSGIFEGDKSAIIITPLKKNTLFSQTDVWDDFSIEFWLAPVYASDNETIFLWEGAMKSKNEIIPQEVKCSIQNRRISWELKNFFISADNTKSIMLTGNKELVPRIWHHHLLRFDSRIGLIEYLIDGIPEAMSHATESGKESSLILHPYSGNVLPVSIVIGKRYTGYIDELRISKRFIDKPILKKYTGVKGKIESRVFDLGGSGSLVKSLEVSDSIPGNGHISYFIRAADSFFTAEHPFDLPWTEVDPHNGFGKEIRGRFVQVAAELSPDGWKTVSPILSRIILVTEPELPPPSPIGLFAIPGNGKVTLRWKRVNHETLKGYRIYYGGEPGNYESTESPSGPSPIDAGNVVQFDVTGLTNGNLYFFSVVAYDSEVIPNVSGFSKEVNARPSGLFK